MPKDFDSRLEPAPWSDVVAICAKCAAKLGRGHKGKTELRGEIKQALKKRGLAEDIRVVETTCLDLCPKGGQTVATGRQLAKGRLTVVGPDADGEAVVTLLFDSQTPLLSKTPLVEGRASGSDRKKAKPRPAP
jgi:predicted metal-binding protein